jgi:peptidoglycan-associated lipoprotein
MPRLLLCLTLSLSIALLCGCNRRAGLNDDFNVRIQEFKATVGDNSPGIEVGSTNNGGNDDAIDFAPPPPTAVSTDWADLVTAVTGDESVVPERRWSEVVFFAYNQHVIGEAERQKVEGLADYLKRNRKFGAIIEGHCDSRGSDEFNRALGERRALAVRDYLLELGIDKARLQTVSYGEEKPADPGENEAAFARNRRAEFVIVQN